jgi:hypothetical protein
VAAVSINPWGCSQDLRRQIRGVPFRFGKAIARSLDPQMFDCDFHERLLLFCLRIVFKRREETVWAVERIFFGVGLVYGKDPNRQKKKIPAVLEERVGISRRAG